MRLVKKLLLSILLMGCIQVTFAWNFIGHAVIAQIAYQQLTPTAKKKVDQLVLTFSHVYPNVNSYQKMADWADTVRKDGVTEFSAWHFIDKPFSVDGSSLPYYGKENVAWAITQTENSLNVAKNPFNQALSLAMLTHFVGDIEQPLHCATRVSKKNPQGDRGGNLYLIKSDYANNLHDMWDQGLGLFTPSATDSIHSQITNLATTIQREYPPQTFQKILNDNNPYDWAKYGFNTAKNFAYSTPEHKTPSDQYIAKGQKIVMRQTAIAGYRLAKILNKILA